jgi:aminopeptidase N
LQLRDTPAGLTAVYPSSLGFEAPSYMIAWASGDYTKLDLGITALGTSIAAWHLPESATQTTAGTANLRAFFEYFEGTLGPYPYGPEAGSVEVVWGPGALGGMEHHPYWHVASGAMGDEDVHAHEAAHGWFGNGIRIACWEDFVLSEGTVSYLTARALAAVLGNQAADMLWTRYQERLDSAMSSPNTLKIAWPDSCGAIDIVADGLFSHIPYMKGAFFFRALEERVGVTALDAALRSFVEERLGTAAGMQDLLDTVERVTGYDPQACAAAWLRNEAVPADGACP